MKKIIYLFLIVHCTLVIDNCLSQWVQVPNGMEGRLVFTLASDGNNIFAGTDSVGVYLSTNNGTSWTQTTLNNQTVYSLLVNGNNIFAGTSIGVYRTTNNGANWTLVLNNQFVGSLAINGNNIFAGTSIGVYRTTNNGATWAQAGLNGQFVLSLAVNGSNIFAGTFTGVYRTTNNGATWTQTTLNNQLVSALAVNGNNIFAGTFPNGVYISNDNGTNWIQTFLNNQNVLSLAVSGNNIFAGTGSPTPNGVFVSNNNGANWTQRNQGFPPTIDIHALCIFNNYIFAGTGNSVYRRLLSELIGIQPISNEVPNQFSLSQNYPNPFNPVTKIRFALPKSTFASIVVYDILGRSVETIVNEQLNAGTYEADWLADKIASGVYYYKLVTEDYTETRKMVLIK
jgi:hypothetical protein